MDLKPANAVTIIECDMNVEFDAPEGYVEPDYKSTVTEMVSAVGGGHLRLCPAQPAAPPVPPKQPKRDQPFASSGVRLDGKSVKQRTVSSSSSLGPSNSLDQPPTPAEELADVVPDENYRPGRLDFVRYAYKNRAVLEKELRERQRAQPVPFGGNRLGGHSVNNFKPFEGAAQSLRGSKR